MKFLCVWLFVFILGLGLFVVYVLNVVCVLVWFLMMIFSI